MDLNTKYARPTNTSIWMIICPHPVSLNSLWSKLYPLDVFNFPSKQWGWSSIEDVKLLCTMTKQILNFLKIINSFLKKFNYFFFSWSIVFFSSFMIIYFQILASYIYDIFQHLKFIFSQNFVSIFKGLFDDNIDPRVKVWGHYWPVFIRI